LGVAHRGCSPTLKPAKWVAESSNPILAKGGTLYCVFIFLKKKYGSDMTLMW
jgi:hypothetical protein